MGEPKARSSLRASPFNPSHALNGPRSYTALVLAGTRGDDDALAQATGSPHRALLDLDGIPMLERVVATLDHSPAIDRVWVSIDRPQRLNEQAGLKRRIASGQLGVLESEPSPSLSVLAGIESIPGSSPLLVTTADHALLDTAMVAHFLAAADASDADLAVGVVSEDVIRAKFPGSRRTYFRFRGGRFSGANLFALRTPEALSAVRFWRRAEQHRKRPWRLVGAFGAVSLLLFALRRLDLDQAVARASRTLGTRLCAIQMPQPEAALDVDHLEDYEQVLSILKTRKSPDAASAQSTP